MGVFNGEKTLQSSIQSILNQTYTNWEFIICDDCSKDNTWKILESYSIDSRFILIKNQKNLGLAASLNHCLKKASGKYLVRQDADDTSHADRFEVQLSYLEVNPHIDILGSYASLVNEHGTPWGSLKCPLHPKLNDWIKGSSVIHASVFMKTETIQSIGGYDPKAIRVEDYDLWMRLVSVGICIESIPVELYDVHWTEYDYIRKKFKYRLNEIRYRFYGFKKMKVPFWAYVYILKPIIVGLLPSRVLQLIHQKKFVR